jgi:hypothetical protein
LVVAEVAGEVVVVGVEVGVADGFFEHDLVVPVLEFFGCGGAGA